MSPRYSFVIPVYEDAEALERTLEVLTKFECKPEIVVVDASPDKGPSREVAAKFGIVYGEADKASRGTQLAQGARIATGDVFVFHHADTEFGAEHMRALEEVMRTRGCRQECRHYGDVQAGAFFKDVRFLYPGWAWSEKVYRWYARRWGILYGDQSVFVRCEYFEELGGVRDIPIMEDVEFSGRLRRGKGRIKLLDPPLRTSMRKFTRDGLYRRKTKNILLVWLFRCGVSPERIYGWYYGR